MTRAQAAATGTPVKDYDDDIDKRCTAAKRLAAKTKPSGTPGAPNPKEQGKPAHVPNTTGMYTPQAEGNDGASGAIT